MAKNSRPDEGTIVIAARQSSGRGRAGRTWLSPKGGIYLSIILKPDINSYLLSEITTVTSVAVLRTLKGLTGMDIKIKWPNDIIISGKKLGGILAEKTKSYVIVGIGINVNNDVSDIQIPNGYRAISISDVSGRDADIQKITKILIKEFSIIYEQFKITKLKNIIDEYRAHSSVAGQWLKVSMSDCELEGKAVDIGPHGELIIKDSDGKIKRLLVGDVIKTGI